MNSDQGAGLRAEPTADPNRPDRCAIPLMPGLLSHQLCAFVPVRPPLEPYRTSHHTRGGQTPDCLASPRQSRGHPDWIDRSCPRQAALRSRHHALRSPARQGCPVSTAGPRSPQASIGPAEDCDGTGGAHAGGPLARGSDCKVVMTVAVQVACGDGVAELIAGFRLARHARRALRPELRAIACHAGGAAVQDVHCPLVRGRCRLLRHADRAGRRSRHHRALQTQALNRTRRPCMRRPGTRSHHPARLRCPARAPGRIRDQAPWEPPARRTRRRHPPRRRPARTVRRLPGHRRRRHPDRRWRAQSRTRCCH